ncbi:tetratricopeptide repeat protein [Apirhabdus apintestini]|nr:tetratricopeptide repeat protein [Enterobacteriaceae bacterium CA-0114]
MMDASHIGQLRAFFAGGGSLRMLNDTSPEEMDRLWRYGCRLLQQGKAASARNLFQLLVYCDAWNSDYLLSLGVACQLTNAHQDAVVYLIQAAQILVTDPRPVSLLARSAAALQQWESAGELYQGALTLANGRAEWRALSADAHQQLALCRQQTTQERHHES